MTRRALAEILSGAALLSFAVPASAAGQPDSGIVGVVRLIATCRLPGPPPCRTQTRTTSVRVQVARAADGAVVATVRVRDGRFRVFVEPGKYLLRRLPSAPGTTPRRVIVRPQAFTLVVLG